MRQLFGKIGKEIPEELQPHWAASPIWKQVHGTAIAEVIGERQSCGEVDALYTYVPRIPLTVITADCVPVLLEKKDRSAVAVAHAGWRGTLADIVPNLWKCLEARGETPQHWRAYVGPAIGGCCYDVDKELAQKFEIKFGNLLQLFGAEMSGLGLVERERFIHLARVNMLVLRSLGFEDVSIARLCTKCSKGQDGSLYHSYRRAKDEGKQAGRQYSGLIIP